MAQVLLISKPVTPPWNDSGKNLVRDLALALDGHAPTVFGVRGEAALPEPVRTWPLYPARTGGFSPRRSDQARVLAALLAERSHDLWHYFFAPNPVTCRVGGGLRKLRRKPTLHTVSSAPRSPAQVVPLLFADLHVVLSAHTEARLLRAGLSADRLVRIPPCVSAPAPPTEPARSAARARFGLPQQVPLVVFPGDLEFGGGAERMVEAFGAMRERKAHLVMACREKTPRARDARQALRAQLSARGLDARAHFIGETPDILGLLGAADVVALPSTDLYAKMDYPLVLLEAMALQRAVVVADGTPAAELAEAGGVIAEQPDAEALAARFDALIGDDATRAHLGAAARLQVTEHYSPAAVARAYGSAYDRLR